MVDLRFFSDCKQIKASDLAGFSKANLRGDGNRVISGIAPLEEAGQKDLSFFDNPLYREQFINCKAGAICIHTDHTKYAPSDACLIISDSPYRSYALAVSALFPPLPDKRTISSSACIHSSAKIGRKCTIEAGVVIENNVEIGDECVIGANSVIKSGVLLGRGCSISNGVSISHSLIGDGVHIGPGSRIGQEGFGFVPDPGNFLRVPQLGRVQIGDGAGIGANCTIDRGTAGDTIVGEGCRLDNMVHLAHNVRLGRGCIIAGQCGIAGSSILGDFVQLGGQAGISGHLIIGDGAKIAAGSGVIQNVSEGVTVGGYPAIQIRDWHRQTLNLRNLEYKKPTKEIGSDA